MSRGVRRDHQLHDLRSLGLVEPKTAVVREETFPIRFWGRIAVYAEGKWLEANGWRRCNSGWLLPDWHPKKMYSMRKDIKIPGAFGFKDYVNTRDIEPYDQNHAANSQRAHGARRTVQARHVRRHKAPAFPSYVRVKPFQAVLNTLLLLAVSFQLSFMGHWASYLFSLAAGLVFCVSFFIGWKTRREWELEWAESKLAGRTHGIHGPN